MKLKGFFIILFFAILAIALLAQFEYVIGGYIGIVLLVVIFFPWFLHLRRYEKHFRNSLKDIALQACLEHKKFRLDKKLIETVPKNTFTNKQYRDYLAGHAKELGFKEEFVDSVGGIYKNCFVRIGGARIPVIGPWGFYGSKINRYLFMVVMKKDYQKKYLEKDSDFIRGNPKDIRNDKIPKELRRGLSAFLFDNAVVFRLSGFPTNRKKIMNYLDLAIELNK